MERGGLALYEPVSFSRLRARTRQTRGVQVGFLGLEGVHIFKFVLNLLHI